MENKQQMILIIYIYIRYGLYHEYEGYTAITFESALGQGTIGGLGIHRVRMA